MKPRPVFAQKKRDVTLTGRMSRNSVLKHGWTLGETADVTKKRGHQINAFEKKVQTKRERTPVHRPGGRRDVKQEKRTGGVRGPQQNQIWVRTKPGGLTLQETRGVRKGGNPNYRTKLLWGKGGGI